MVMRKRRLARKGQSILEYLVIATVIVAAIIAIRQTVATNMSSLYTGAANKTSVAATQLSGLVIDGGNAVTPGPGPGPGGCVPGVNC